MRRGFIAWKGTVRELRRTLAVVHHNSGRTPITPLVVRPGARTKPEVER